MKYATAITELLAEALVEVRTLVPEVVGYPRGVLQVGAANRADVHAEHLPQILIQKT